MNKNLGPVRTFFFREWLGRTMPQLNVFQKLELSETSRSKKLIFGLQVNIAKANSRRYDVTQ